jgi:hypothetical protein
MRDPDDAGMMDENGGIRDDSALCQEPGNISPPNVPDDVI